MALSVRRWRAAVLFADAVRGILRAEGNWRAECMFGWVLLQKRPCVCHSTRDRIVGCVGFFCGSRINVHNIAPHVDMRLGCVINSRVRVALRVPGHNSFLWNACSLMVSLSSSIDHVAHLDILHML